MRQSIVGTVSKSHSQIDYRNSLALYDARLDKLNSLSSSFRRTKGDLITVFKSLKGKFASYMYSLFLYSKTENLRRHSKMSTSLEHITCQLTNEILVESTNRIHNPNALLRLHLSKISKKVGSSWETIIARTDTGRPAFPNWKNKLV